MSAARSTRSARAPRSSAAAKETNAPTTQTITLPTLQSMFSPILNSTNAATNPSKPCNCGCCQTSTTICLTFDTTWLQNLVNMFPKINITNNNTCADEDCGCDDNEPVAGK